MAQGSAGRIKETGISGGGVKVEKVGAVVATDVCEKESVISVVSFSGICFSGLSVKMPMARWFLAPKF